MIRRFKHGGLARLFQSGDRSGVNPAFAPKLRRMLAVLDKAKKPSDMDLPGWRLHPMRGDRKGQWAVEVSGNWRLVFEFDNEDAVGVDLEDYH
jgi:proteic killer suppression protein